jgi:hypothetical protein
VASCCEYGDDLLFLRHGVSSNCEQQVKTFSDNAGKLLTNGGKAIIEDRAKTNMRTKLIIKQKLQRL